MELHIGFDDTDSPEGGCTTYVAALVIEKIREFGVSFIDYPNLIRLNPNVPWKTRGNGALCIRVRAEEDKIPDIEECVISIVREQSNLRYPGTDPGIVFLNGNLNNEILEFAKKTITGLVDKSTALRIIEKSNGKTFTFKKGRGIIGGLAAIGERLNYDHTFELIAYRRFENRGSIRKVDNESIIYMDQIMGISLFNNLDPENGRIIITPRGPDPILYGIRGENPEAVKNGHNLVHSNEPIERWVIFRTNQGTDAHFNRVKSIDEIRSYTPVIIKGRVACNPKIIRGGHVIFKVEDETGQVDCAAYKPTGKLRDITMKLAEGDSILAYGGVRPPFNFNPMTINLEKIRLINISPILISRNPICVSCGKRMKSIGRGQGFECLKCGFHGKKLKKKIEVIKRSITPDFYFASLRSQRHLTKPFQRYGLEKTWLSIKKRKPISFERISGI